MNKQVGIIIGRFQVPTLHQGHLTLISVVQSLHEHVLILVGESRAVWNAHDPLPAAARIVMLKSSPIGKNVKCAILPNCPLDRQWSGQIDRLVESLYPGYKAILYGGRDSCLSHYCGKFETHDLPVDHERSGQTVREQYARLIPEDVDFRHGVIFAAMNRPPISFQTTDIAIYHPEFRQVVLGQKTQNHTATPGWRFPGGFVDPTDANLEMAAIRESHEEVGSISLGTPTYLGSYRVKDWRYRDSPDQICTAFFAVQCLWGAPKAGDDLAVAQWFSYDDLSIVPFVPEHVVLRNRFVEWIQTHV